MKIPSPNLRFIFLFSWHCLLQSIRFNSNEVVYQLFLSWITPLRLYVESNCHTQGHLDFPLCYLLEVNNCMFYIRYVIHFELIFLKGVKSVLRLIFLCGCPVVPTSFVEKALFALLYCLFFFAKDHITIFMWVYFWSL